MSTTSSPGPGDTSPWEQGSQHCSVDKVRMRWGSDLEQEELAEKGCAVEEHSSGEKVTRALTRSLTRSGTREAQHPGWGLGTRWESVGQRGRASLFQQPRLAA